MILAALFAWSASAAATPMTIAAVPVEQLHGRGAAVPFAEYEAENARFGGTLIGPSRRLSDIAAEASGRRAVRLDRIGQFVEFTLARPANAVTVRYAIPDSPSGSGRDSTIGVYVGQERVASLQLTSRYGWFYGRYPFSNRPSDGAAHHFFDEARQLLPRTLAAGTRVRLQVDGSDPAPWTVVDLADFEQVAAPRPAPEGALDLTRFGGDPTGRRDSTRALEAAIRAGQRTGRPVWIGRGTFRVDSHVIVDRVTVAGAGPWYSILKGRGCGLYGKPARHGSAGVHLSGFAIIGDVRERVDRARLAAIGGSIGGGSTIRDLWIQHHKTGIWLDGPLDGITIENARIVDNSADGLNLAGGAANATIRDVFVRNSGDDGIALWSRRSADRNVTIANDTVIAPVLANGIAVYGGRDIVVANNLAADTLTEGGGIHLANRFHAVPLSGRIGVHGNLLVRTGSYDPHWRFGIGAVWLYAPDAPIDAAIDLDDNELVDTTLPALQFLGESIAEVQVHGLDIEGAYDWLQVQSAGSASFAGVRARGLDHVGYGRCNASFRATFANVDPALTKAEAGLCGALDPAVVDQRLSR
jgi:hypothetical protein